MQEIIYTLTLTTPVANGICTAQKPAAGGVQYLNLNGSLVSGGVATLDCPRRIIIASTGSDSSIVFTITGTTWNDRLLSEAMTGTGYTNFDFKTVTSITVSGNTAGNITVGTNQVASTQWVPLDICQVPFNVAVYAMVSSDFTGTYTLEQTPMNIYESTYINTDPQYIYSNDIGNMARASDSEDGILNGPTRACRLTLNTYTSGSIVFKVIQGGI